MDASKIIKNVVEVNLRGKTADFKSVRHTVAQPADLLST